jgi:hypothetical protein
MGGVLRKEILGAVGEGIKANENIHQPDSISRKASMKLNAKYVHEIRNIVLA